jgi:hypothetical protein
MASMRERMAITAVEVVTRFGGRRRLRDRRGARRERRRVTIGGDEGDINASVLAPARQVNWIWLRNY